MCLPEKLIVTNLISPKQSGSNHSLVFDQIDFVTSISSHDRTAVFQRYFKTEHVHMLNPITTEPDIGVSSAYVLRSQSRVDFLFPQFIFF